VGANAGEDLTGTVIESSQPVAVFAGHDCSTVPDARPGCDHLEEQILPTRTWGQRTLVSQLRDRGTTERARVRIVSAKDGNTLTFDGIATPSECSLSLRAGEWCEFETSRSFEVTGTEPFLVTQYMLGLGMVSQCEASAGLPPPDRPECAGDPAMVIEVPVEQYRSEYAFLVPDNYPLNLMNVVAPEGSVILLDGAAVPADNSVYAGGGHRVYFVAMLPGMHRIAAADGSTRFGIKLYGVAPFTSYMAPGGLALTPLFDPR
jgi:hypothetical protein